MLLWLRRRRGKFSIKTTRGKTQDMRVFYSEKHKLRDAKTELHGGLLVKPFEGPFRAEWVLAGVKEAGFTDVRAPAEHGLETALKVHDAGYLEFLRTCWDRWQAHGFEGEAIAKVHIYHDLLIMFEQLGLGPSSQQ